MGFMLSAFGIAKTSPRSAKVIHIFKDYTLACKMPGVIIVMEIPDTPLFYRNSKVTLAKVLPVTG